MITEYYNTTSRIVRALKTGFSLLFVFYNFFRYRPPETIMGWGRLRLVENDKECTELLIPQSEALFYASQKDYNKYELISCHLFL